MSNKGAPFLSFLVGMVVGAVVALLYAPTSGEELRAQIRTEADASLEKLSAEWEKTLAELQQAVDNTRSEVTAYLEQLQQVQEEELAEEEIAEEEV